MTDINLLEITSFCLSGGSFSSYRDAGLPMGEPITRGPNSHHIIGGGQPDAQPVNKKFSSYTATEEDDIFLRKIYTS